MSGFEVAGVVLGAFPIAISALEKYREVANRAGLFWKIRVEHKKCSDELKFHQLRLKTNLKSLLLPLGVDDGKLTKLLSNPGGDGWREREVAEQLEQRLQDAYELYLDYIKGMERVLEELNHELAFDSDPVHQKITTAVGQLLITPRFSLSPYTNI
jgi:hypothetical protein